MSNRCVIISRRPFPPLWGSGKWPIGPITTTNYPHASATHTGTAGRCVIILRDSGDLCVYFSSFLEPRSSHLIFMASRRSCDTPIRFSSKFLLVARIYFSTACKIKIRNKVLLPLYRTNGCP